LARGEKRPVVDAMVARRDVDPDRIVVIGVSQAGFWVPRALASEQVHAGDPALPRPALRRRQRLAL